MGHIVYVHTYVSIYIQTYIYIYIRPSRNKGYPIKESPLLGCALFYLGLHILSTLTDQCELYIDIICNLLLPYVPLSKRGTLLLTWFNFSSIVN